jgi:hypothetical protein
MSKLSVRNDTGGMLCLWLEPWGTDHWMRPGEEFTVVTEERPAESPFDLVMHDDGISVVVNTAFDATVLDKSGREAPCGHQRPADAGL